MPTTLDIETDGPRRAVRLCTRRELNSGLCCAADCGASGSNWTAALRISWEVTRLVEAGEALDFRPPKVQKLAVGPVKQDTCRNWPFLLMMDYHGQRSLLRWMVVKLERIFVSTYL